MLRRLSLSLVLALSAAPQLGCSLVHRAMHARELSAMAATAAKDPPGKTRSPIEAIRDRLRERRERSPGDFSMEDALDLSAVEAGLDAGSTAPPTTNGGSSSSLAAIPRATWWYLIVPPSEWSRGPLAIDQEGMPGYYAAMMSALDAALASDPKSPLTADGYLELHRKATQGVWDKAHGKQIAQGFLRAPMSFPLAALHDMRTLHVEHLATAIAELKTEGVAGWNADLQAQRGAGDVPAWLAKILTAQSDINPHSKPTKLTYVREKDAHGGAGFAEWLVGSNDYHPDEAQKWAAQWLAEYASESGSGDLRAIAKLIRRLQVSHLFGDASTPLDSMVVLNALLARAGQAPSIVEDATMFSGRESIDELVNEIRKGQDRFATLQKELAARAVEAEKKP